MIAEGVLESPLCLTWSVATATLSGEVESGDRHLVQPFENGVLVAAVDGLGHGDEAAAAAKLAIGAIADSPQDSVIALFKRCHERLIRSRGVVMSVASFWRDGTMTWAGVGNIEGVLIREDSESGPSREHMLVHGGVVGYQLPPLRASVLPLGRGDTLIFVTDGIARGFLDRFTVAKAARMGMPGGSSELRHIADRILDRHATGADDALVVVARYWGAPG